MSEELIIVPRLSEKAVAAAADQTYVFNVPLTANKQTVAAAVKMQFNVNPIDVRLVVVKGKPKRFSRGKRAYPGTTNKVDTKKAYVRLSEGENLSLYDADEETK